MYNRDNDTEFLFNQEVREKKRTASGIHSKTGKRGYVGVMRTPVDLMNRKEKRQYMKGSKVIVTNKYVDIKKVPSLEELEEMNKETAKNVILTVRGFHSLKKLADHWDITNNDIYRKVYAQYDIETSGRRGGSKKGWKKKIKENKNEDAVISQEQSSIVNETVEKTEPIIVEQTSQVLPKDNVDKEVMMNIVNQLMQVNNMVVQTQHAPITTGFKMAFSGCYDTEIVRARVNGMLGAILEGKKYNIKFELEEIEEEVE